MSRNCCSKQSPKLDSVMAREFRLETDLSRVKSAEPNAPRQRRFYDHAAIPSIKTIKRVWSTSSKVKLFPALVGAESNRFKLTPC